MQLLVGHSPPERKEPRNRPRVPATIEANAKLAGKYKICISNKLCVEYDETLHILLFRYPPYSPFRPQPSALRTQYSVLGPQPSSLTLQHLLNRHHPLLQAHPPVRLGHDLPPFGRQKRKLRTLQRRRQLQLLFLHSLG